jgi:hypothetical protein
MAQLYSVQGRRQQSRLRELFAISHKTDKRRCNAKSPQGQQIPKPRRWLGHPVHCRAGDRCRGVLDDPSVVGFSGSAITTKAARHRAVPPNDRLFEHGALPANKPASRASVGARLPVHPTRFIAWTILRGQARSYTIRSRSKSTYRQRPSKVSCAAPLTSSRQVGPVCGYTRFC